MARTARLTTVAPHPAKTTTSWTKRSAGGRPRRTRRRWSRVAETMTATPRSMASSPQPLPVVRRSSASPAAQSSRPPIQMQVGVPGSLSSAAAFALASSQSPRRPGGPRGDIGTPSPAHLAVAATDAGRTERERGKGLSPCARWRAARESARWAGLVSQPSRRPAGRSAGSLAVTLSGPAAPEEPAAHRSRTWMHSASAVRIKCAVPGPPSG